MADVWRIFVVEGDEALNQSLVKSLRKDGYIVQGVGSGRDAVRALWSEEYDVVVYSLKTPGGDGFELLQWLRAYRPNTHMLIVGEANAAATRMRALESGAVSYLEEPLDFRVLKEELRRLLQKTGFSASLDSFDLLDVIQIITMSRKSIALLVNTGLEERGILRFQNGELVWAEYGILRGEEAFFALAAHKNGTVIHQPWNEQVVSNVTQPLSRLIFQALQYRTKYANSQQYSGEIESVQVSPFSSAEIDDTPFVVLPTSQPQLQAFTLENKEKEPVSETAGSGQKEWWEQTGRVASVNTHTSGTDYVRGGQKGHSGALAKGADMSIPPRPNAPLNRQRTDLPSWLTDQPTASNLPVIKQADELHPHTLSPIPATPEIETPSSEWSLHQKITTTDPLPSKQPAPPRKDPAFREKRPSSSPSWDLATPASSSSQDGLGAVRTAPQQVRSGPLPSLTDQNIGATQPSSAIKTQQAARKNYAALVSALQTLGYTMAGFVAAAVVTIEGQPLAQVAVDDMDITKLCKYFSTIQKGVLLALDEKGWGGYEDTVITSTEHYILMRMIGAEKRTFLVVMAARTTDPGEFLSIMSNVEGTINQALQ